MRPAILAGDAEAVRARRMLAKLIREEPQMLALAAERRRNRVMRLSHRPV